MYTMTSVFYAVRHIVHDVSCRELVLYRYVTHSTAKQPLNNQPMASDTQLTSGEFFSQEKCLGNDCGANAWGELCSWEIFREGRFFRGEMSVGAFHGVQIPMQYYKSPRPVNGC